MRQVFFSGVLFQATTWSRQALITPEITQTYLPFAGAAVSAGLFLFQVPRGRQLEPDHTAYQYNQKAISVWKIVRLLVCFTLTALAAISGWSDTQEECFPINCLFTHSAKLYTTLFYIYNTLLAIISLTLAPKIQITANSHLVLLLLIAFGVQAWNYLVPFALSNQYPAESYRWLTWLHVGLLGFVAVIVPLCIPRLYIPLDPKNPSTPNREQTASLISLITYTYLDPIIFASYRAPKLEYDELPPLADYEHAAVLRLRGLDALDPMNGERNRKRHVFWGLMQIFWREYCVMAILATIKAVTELSGPVGVRFLLKYIENPSEPEYFRPWVWVVWLFLGPVLGSLSMQRYLFLASRCLVHTEAIITQIIFEHSLRIRMVSAVPNKTSEISDERTVIEGGEVDNTRSADTSETPTMVASTSSASVKGKEQDDDEGSNLIGKINNLMSTDLGNIVEGRDFVFLITYAPIQIVCSALILYWILGWSAVVGMACMALFFPLPGKVAHLVNGIQGEKMKKTDARVQSITEVMNVIRMIKLFGWEAKIRAQVDEKRETELHWYRKKRVLVLVNLVTNYTLPTIIMVITFACHTLVFKQSLDASMVFSSIGVFELLRNQLHFLFAEIATQVQAKVSLDRVDDFMKNTELLDVHTRKSSPSIETTMPSAIGFRNATFTWAQRAASAPTLSTRNFRLDIDQELLFHRGKINMIVGPTGCGKTCLLMALLGEMHFEPSAPDSWFALPREGGVAYAAQEAWVLNETIRDNILFGSEYDENRYNNVLSQCALDKDLVLFDAGDQTEVGEKGLTLSGGQKARVSLARAIYSKADIVILDDILSALDVHTSRWIVENCFRGDLVSGRTVLIVTHNVAIVSEVAEYVVSLANGRVVHQGYVSEVLRTNARFRAEVQKEKQNEEKAAETIESINLAEAKPDNENSKKRGGKLMVEEEVVIGHVGWPALKLFLLSFGGSWFWLVCLGGFMLADAVLTFQSYWIGVWARAYSTYPGHPEQVNATFYLAVYIAICLSGVCMYSGAYIMHILGSVRAARRIHGRLVTSILGAPLRWLDSTPVGRVIARFTQDIRSVDETLPLQLESFVNITYSMCSSFLVVIIFSPQFMIPGVTILAVGFWVGHIYIRSQLSVKREMSNARSPLFSHFGTSLAGITSIRAYGVEDQFKNEALKRVDKYTRTSRTFYNLNRWISFRMDVLGGVFAAGLATYLVYVGSSPDASNTGFSLNRAVVLSGCIIWWVRALNDFEVQGNSLERIQGYVEIEQEAAPVPEKMPPAHWPSSGNIVVEGLTARYSSDGPAVLHGLSFEIKSGERIGIVGRTGSGKSSLMLSLLRMIPIEGNVCYDGIPTHAVNLDALRTAITIIPQQPELISGTVRQNLDPFDEHDDAFLNIALHSAGLDSIQPEDIQDRIVLDSGVSAGGGNFSLGQRQMLALARAIVRQSKVLILDEATAAIDHNSDAAIQASIRTELNGMTLIIVAHRLQTICDADKIMVLEAGKIVEFDSPVALLQKQNGAFKSLVDESGDRDRLYAMAKGQKY
ncbi:multidrug resistance-associated ABC transporter [Rhizoctonia solani 123E]|uniref:Multidrug resistance-associated ABC transporter n=1 Tax=Rhizoctonia solani 123E TaxID=1423351 RepID=A0A074SQA5_9AGAM|nr:multidrug resistance-associated ABC transporter [Rhizoctonia solani 123E]